MLNASNTINGGLIALAVEEALLSLSPGATLSSLALRYLQPARVGPVVAEAEVRQGLGQVEVRDAGNENRLCVVATSRTFELTDDDTSAAEEEDHDEGTAPGPQGGHDRRGTRRLPGGDPHVPRGQPGR